MQLITYIKIWPGVSFISRVETKDLVRGVEKLKLHSSFEKIEELKPKASVFIRPLLVKKLIVKQVLRRHSNEYNLKTNRLKRHNNPDFFFSLLEHSVTYFEQTRELFEKFLLK